MLINETKIILIDQIVSTPEDLALVIHETMHETNALYSSLGYTYLGLMRNSQEPENLYKAYLLIIEGISNNLGSIIKTTNYLKDNPDKSPVIDKLVFTTTESALVFLGAMGDEYRRCIDRLNTFRLEMEDLINKGK